MKGLLSITTAAGFLFLAGCYTVLRHEQVVIPAVDDAVEETNEAGVTVVSECATCHEESFTNLDYTYHSFTRVHGRYAIWLEYYENSEPWWITVPAHDAANSSSGETENDNGSFERRNYGGRRTTSERDHTSNSVTSGSTVNSEGSGTSTTSTSNSTGSTTEQDSGGKNERSTQDRTQRGPRSDGTQRETSGRKTNKK